MTFEKLKWVFQIQKQFLNSFDWFYENIFFLVRIIPLKESLKDETLLKFHLKALIQNVKTKVKDMSKRALHYLKNIFVKQWISGLVKLTCISYSSCTYTTIQVDTPKYSSFDKFFLKRMSYGIVNFWKRCN